MTLLQMDITENCISSDITGLVLRMGISNRYLVVINCDNL